MLIFHIYNYFLPFILSFHCFFFPLLLTCPTLYLATSLGRWIILPYVVPLSFHLSLPLSLLLLTFSFFSPFPPELLMVGSKEGERERGREGRTVQLQRLSLICEHFSILVILRIGCWHDEASGNLLTARVKGRRGTSLIEKVRPRRGIY